MRVLVIGRFTSIHTRRFAEELKRQGVNVAALHIGRSNEKPNVKCYHATNSMQILGIPRTATLGCLLYLRNALRDFKPEIIHVQDSPGMLRMLCIVHPKTARLAYSAWGHLTPQTLSDSQFHKGLARAALLVSDAPDVLDELTRFSPRAGRVIMRFGADLDLFSPGAPDLAFLAQYGLDPNGLYILSPRSLRHNYNQLLLIRSLPDVIAKYPEMRLVLKHHHVENYADSPAYQECIYREAIKLGVWKHIVRIDHIPYKNMNDLFRLCKVTVSVPLEDGFPATIFESMACGCPLIVSQDRSYDGVIEDGYNALTVPTNDPRPLTRALLKILDDKEFSEGLKVNGLETVRSKGNFGAEVARTVQAYREVL